MFWEDLLHYLPWSTILTYLGFFVVGFGLLFVAWRMRFRTMAQNHPRCMKCSFDLHMRWPEATRCPECGADLLSMGSVGYMDNRQQLLYAAMLGATAIVVLFGTFFSARNWVLNENWIPYEPTAWLISDMFQFEDRWSSQIIWQELQTRMKTGRFVEDHRKDLDDCIGRILHPDDGKQMPVQHSGGVQQFFFAARDLGLVTELQLQDYLDQSVKFEFTNVVYNEDSPGAILFALHTVATSGQYSGITLRLPPWLNLKVDDKYVDGDPELDETSNSASQDTYDETYVLKVDGNEMRLGAGEHTLSLQVVFEDWRGNSRKLKVVRRYRITCHFRIEPHVDLTVMGIRPKVYDVKVETIANDAPDAPPE